MAQLSILPNTELNTRIKTLMIEQNVNQRTLSVKSGICQSYLSNLLGGKLAFSMQKLQTIAKALNTTTDLLTQGLTLEIKQNKAKGRPPKKQATNVSSAPNVSLSEMIEQAKTLTDEVTSYNDRINELNTTLSTLESDRKVKATQLAQLTKNILKSNDTLAYLMANTNKN